MNPLCANFDELYQRHLCRHSQWEINVLHLAAVAGVYFALGGLVLLLPHGRWIAGGLLAVYFAVLAPNVPWKVWLANVLAVAVVWGALLAIPPLAAWAYLALLFGSHRFQIWNHRKYDASYDMTAFAQKYPKGPALFCLLAIYELPILLYYLCFDPRPQAARGPSGVASLDQQ